MSSLHEPLQLGELKLKNRIVMAPLTRSRAGAIRTPNDLMLEYYVQRASAGMILTEATSIVARGVGYADTPGIWSKEQVAGWKKITDAVHAKGGTIVMQLWHVGRISDPSFLDGKLPVAPSAIAAGGHVSLLRPERPYVTPQELSIAEIKEIIEAYRQGAANAKEAGFDGVEIHGANGYLPDQFLHDGSNKRTDEYGGSIVNRAQFLLQATDAAISVWGAGRVGVHLSPRGDSHDVVDSDPRALFSYVASELGKRKVAFLFLREHQGSGRIGPELRKIFGGPVIANEKFTPAEAARVLERNEADAVSFGRLYIANPDLPERMKAGAALNELDLQTAYFGGAKGYTDYPTMK